ncbi:MAG: hypothetical protein AAF990_01725 [Bacteroidota bacterium]
MDDPMFEKHFQDRLRETQSFDFEESAWESVASRLDQAQKKRPLAWLWWFSGGLLAVAVLGFFLWSHTTQEAISTPTPLPKTTGQPNPSIDKQPIASTSKPAKQTKAEADSKQVKSRRDVSDQKVFPSSSPKTSNRPRPQRGSAPIMPVPQGSQPNRRSHRASAPLAAFPFVASKPSRAKSTDSIRVLPHKIVPTEARQVVCLHQKMLPTAIGISGARGSLYQEAYDNLQSVHSNRSHVLQLDLYWRLHRRFWLQLGLGHHWLEQEISLEPSRSGIQLPGNAYLRPGEYVSRWRLEQRHWQYQVGFRLFPVQLRRWQLFTDLNLGIRQVYRGQQMANIGNFRTMESERSEEIPYETGGIHLSEWQIGLGASYRLLDRWWLEAGWHRSLLIKERKESIYTKQALRIGLRFQY